MLAAPCLLLALVQLLADGQEPGEDRHVERGEHWALREAGATLVQDDVLGVDHAFEVARAERVERSLDVWQLPASQRLEVEVPPGDGVVVVGSPDEHDATTDAAGLGYAVQLEGDDSAAFLAVREHLQLLAGEPDRVDLAVLDTAVLGDEHDVNDRVLLDHPDGQFRPDVAFEVVQVGEVVDLVVVDVDHVDDRAPPGVELASDLHELLGQRRKRVHFLSRNLPAFVHRADDLTLEAPHVPRPQTNWVAGEREVVTLVERRDQAEAEASETAGLLDALADALQRLSELLARRALTVVENDDLTRLEVDPDEHLLRRSIDGILDRLHQRETQGRVRVREAVQRLSQVETQVILIRVLGHDRDRTCVFGSPC